MSTWAQIAERVDDVRVEAFLRGRFASADDAEALLGLVASLGYSIDPRQGRALTYSSSHRPCPPGRDLFDLERPVVLRVHPGYGPAVAVLSHPATPSGVGEDLGPAPYDAATRVELFTCKCHSCTDRRSH